LDEIANLVLTKSEDYYLQKEYSNNLELFSKYAK